VEEPIRVALIGAGPMGLWHARSLADIEQADLAAVVDPDEGAGRRAAALAPGAYWSAGPETILSDPLIRAVVIASPDTAHAGLIEQAAQAGKDIFCEKPLATGLAEADAALAAVARHGVKLQIGFQRRFDPAYQRARELIAAGELGPVELAVATTRDALEAERPDAGRSSLSTRAEALSRRTPMSPKQESETTSLRPIARPRSGEWRSPWRRRNAAIFIQITLHDLDSLRFLTGLEVVQVYATASYFGEGPAEEGEVDTAAVVLRFQNGALATITNSWRTAYGYDVHVEVMGPRGKVQVGYDRQTAVRHFSAHGVHHDHVYWYIERFGEAYRREIEHFVDCVARGVVPDVGGADARAAQALAEAAARSLREGHPVDVPLPA
jgi:myo-inositol 2-dehydrogenase/D-chiro-inositol 1-dehydrogenase